MMDVHPGRAPGFIRDAGEIASLRVPAPIKSSGIAEGWHRRLGWKQAGGMWVHVATKTV